MVKLQHLHLPNLTTYTRASTIQNALARRLLDSKKDPTFPIPPPTIITAQFHPVYTTGRRDRNTPSPAQLSRLLQDGKVEFHTTHRGGQITFHGPGQLVAYPIIDLKRHNLTTRCYINLLESALITTCAHYGIKAFRTENTGVWVSETEKIGAIGVHLNRFVSRDGVALNVHTELGWFDRIVACGLEGKGTSSLERLGVRVGVEEVGRVFVKVMAEELEGVEWVEGVEGVEGVGLEDLGLDVE
ncbi:lipoyltransferase [Tothia fuscella]|uniref:Octanoyltransferase n=1 Tax=Tothia fuscella TaxID=1048955 RepID=A0A9P4NHI7_9PEZI|nr:lipoyltransferase [Tothia fuscella]